MVNNNKTFVNDAGYKHKNASTIRLFGNTAKNHITAFNNGDRAVIDSGNTPAVEVK